MTPEQLLDLDPEELRMYLNRVYEEKAKTFTPKEKAKQLVDMFSLAYGKAHATFAVDEIIDAIKVFYNGADWQLHETMGWKFWQNVKEEINKL